MPRALSRRPFGRGIRPHASVRRIIALNNGFQLLFNLHWWMPVFYTYQREAGLGDAEIFGIQSVYYVAFCFLEIPTGLIADRIGPRRCLCLGAVVMTAANATPALWPTYTGFLAHFLAIAVARSLVSGAASAYLYESLHAHGEGDRYLQAEGSARAVGLGAKIVCWPFAGLLMQYVHAAPYLLSALCSAASVACALALPPLPAAKREPAGHARPEPRAEPARTGLAATARRIAHDLRSSPRLGLLMLQGIALFTLARISHVNLFQPMLLDKDVAAAHHGTVLSAMTLAEAIAAARPRWILRHLRGSTAVYALSLLMAGCLAAVVVSGGLATAAWLCVFAAAAGMAFPIQRSLVNDAIPPGADRATLLSLESLLDRGVCAVAAVAVGAYLSAGRLDELLLHVALVTVAGLGALIVVARAVSSRPRPR
ncbi:MFS transporter [Streptomyces sp. TRM64462]|uniref:MFS transporter n=1 Tax=Streptomyces sp. TRM64462 TaxID=2741726 RepID=UPI0015860270|nr:MFS transporter [Streptomyces sp. TRM64462]